jgi:hypothetical protein
MFSGVRASEEETARELPGDELMPQAEVSIDRAFTLPGDPAHVWPWFLHRCALRTGDRVQRVAPPRSGQLNLSNRDHSGSAIVSVGISLWRMIAVATPAGQKGGLGPLRYRALGDFRWLSF